MAVFTDSVLVDLLMAILVTSYLIYLFFSYILDHWDKRGVPNVKTGFMLDVLFGGKSQAEAVDDLYKLFPHEKYFGMFQMLKPQLVVRDYDLINQILVKDFSHFQDRGGPESKNDPMNGNLFNLKGNVWRAMRYKLTPTFTTGKIKGMFDQVSKCGENMVRKIEELSNKHSDVEAKTFMFEFTSEVISSCAFGLQFEVGSPEFEQFKNAISNSFKPSLKTFIKFMIFLPSPKLAETLNLKPFFGKEVTDYFFGLIKATSKYRKENNVKRNDYFQLLLTLQEQEETGTDMSISVTDTTDDDAVIVDQMKYVDQSEQLQEIKLFTDENILANSVIFLIAGSESASNSVSLVLLELARHPEIQHKLQQEIDETTNHNERWTYQTVKDMVYLDQVVQEAQRFYPIIPLLQRECTKPYRLPGTDLVLQKGVLVGVPVIGLHMDPQYYPDPEKFKPERFEGNNFKPNPAFMPFGDGPRICIAMRFAVMEIKVAVARIMAHYSVKLSPKTKQPIKMVPRSFIPLVEGGVWLNFERRK